MADRADLSPEDIRAARTDAPKLRDRDLAENLGISEAQLIAAHIGQSVKPIDAHPDKLLPAVEALGTVMGLTRNNHSVLEIDGPYQDYHPGDHAAMVLAPEIDLRIFPSHWHHGFAVEKETERGVLRSLQVYDKSGDAVHKVYLRETSNHDKWDAVVGTLASSGGPALSVDPRKPVEGAKSNPEKLDLLRQEWARLTDTHQFLRLASKLKMNRLGAYRIAGAPFVRALAPEAVDHMLYAVQDAGIDIMLFVGNRGCIQIHTGPIGRLERMGPWQNILDPGVNLHLRLDKIAEVWAVDKPTRRGKAVSVEAFDAEGGLILQMFGVGKEGRDSRPAWEAIVETLPDRAAEGVA